MEAVFTRSYPLDTLFGYRFAAVAKKSGKTEKAVPARNKAERGKKSKSSQGGNLASERGLEGEPGNVVIQFHGSMLPLWTYGALLI